MHGHIPGRRNGGIVDTRGRPAFQFVADSHAAESDGIRVREIHAGRDKIALGGDFPVVRVGEVRLAQLFGGGGQVAAVLSRIPGAQIHIDRVPRRIAALRIGVGIARRHPRAIVDDHRVAVDHIIAQNHINNGSVDLGHAQAIGAVIRRSKNADRPVNKRRATVIGRHAARDQTVIGRQTHLVFGLNCNARTRNGADGVGDLGLGLARDLVGGKVKAHAKARTVQPRNARRRRLRHIGQSRPVDRRIGGPNGQRPGGNRTRCVDIGMCQRGFISQPVKPGAQNAINGGGHQVKQIARIIADNIDRNAQAKGGVVRGRAEHAGQGVALGAQNRGVGCLDINRPTGIDIGTVFNRRNGRSAQLIRGQRAAKGQSIQVAEASDQIALFADQSIRFRICHQRLIIGRTQRHGPACLNRAAINARIDVFVHLAQRTGDADVNAQETGQNRNIFGGFRRERRTVRRLRPHRAGDIHIRTVEQRLGSPVELVPRHLGRGGVIRIILGQNRQRGPAHRGTGQRRRNRIRALQNRDAHKARADLIGHTAGVAGPNRQRAASNTTKAGRTQRGRGRPIQFEPGQRHTEIINHGAQTQQIAFGN